MDKNQKPIFIVASGRSGSTLIANILNRHKKICIISDLIEPVGDNRFFEKNINVERKYYFNLIQRQTSLSRIFYWRKKETKELLYMPKNDTDVSLLNCYALPFLFNNKVKKFYELSKKIFLKDKRKKRKSEHLKDYFNILKNLSKKKIYVERTGGALHHIEKILNFYPNSKIILNIRNPLETVISYRKHPFFRMYYLMLKKKRFTKWNFNKFLDYSEYSKMLNNWYLKFFKHYKRINKKNFCYYHYENLLENPKENLEKIILFILNVKKLDNYSKKFILRESRKIKPNRPKFKSLSLNSRKKVSKILSKTIFQINKHFPK